MAEKSRMLAQQKLRGRGRQGTAQLPAHPNEFEIEISTSSSSKKSGSGNSNEAEGDFANGGTEIDKLLELETDPAKRIIAHVDMDCFYVSVLCRNKPELQNRPVIVCPSKNIQGTSEVASASYEARQCGIRARMFVSEARKLCPELVVLPCDYALIEDASARVYEQILKYSVLIEPVSADEAYMDVSAWGWHRTQEFAARLRLDIQEATGCPCSVGVGPNKLLARLSTAYAKPLGVRITRLEDAEGFLGNLLAHELPGVGRNLISKLDQKNLKTVGDIRAQSLQRLQLWFGDKQGLMLYDFSRGRDDRPVQTQHKRKSVGTQISWGVRLFTLDDVKKFLNDVAQEVSKRLKEINSKGSRITLRILKKLDDVEEPAQQAAPQAAVAGHMLPPVVPPKGKFMNPGAVQPISKSQRMVSASNEPAVIGAEAFKVFRGMNLSPTDVRGVGLSIDQLEDCEANTGERKIDSFFSKQQTPPSSSRQFAIEKLEDFDDVSIVDEAPTSLGGVKSEFHRPPSASSSSVDARRGPAHFELVYEASSSSISSQDSSQSHEGSPNKHDFAKVDTKVIPSTPPRSADESVSGHLSYNWDEFDDDAMSLSSEVEMYEFSEWNDSELQILDVKPSSNPKPTRKRARPTTPGNADDEVIVLDDDYDCKDSLKPPPPKRPNPAPATSSKILKQPAISEFSKKG
eukprot:TRINITY_DN9964_c0_g1_i1.p1 TRINITY_DN9964_c0_g1~~TRINITY_DN9964_c0_g1_i1.p1  ORF type:complete len:766 (+),score=136.72 TRINITY_DN9964_c0_g1_i1:239-2299(+)